MRDNTQIWIEYSEENLKSAKILLKSNLYNSCLQNVQQSVEKALKAVLVENSFRFQKTHSITELKNLLEEKNTELVLEDNDCDFLDSIYLPSKYPVSNVLPDYEPNKEICSQGIAIAESILALVKNIIK